MDEGVFDAAVAAVVEGDTPDWVAVERDLTSDDDRERLNSLRAIAAVVGRARVELDAQPGDTIGVSAPAAVVEAWGPLQITEAIGRGSHGTVFRAWDTRLARHVALKLLHSRTVASGASILDEARRLARVDHRGVVRIYGADRYDGLVGWWMEHIAGRTLEDILISDGPFGPDEVARIGREVSDALAAVHAAKLIHGDVKPMNIMRERGGRIVLMDFSAGSLSEDDGPPTLAGTPLYMAPEVLRGQPPTVRSDVYSLGVTLFRLVSGAFPYTGGSVAAIKTGHAADKPLSLLDVRPGLPRAFVESIERAILLDPAARYESASSFGSALERIDARRPQRRSRFWLAAAGALLLLAGVTLAQWLPRFGGAAENTRSNSFAAAGLSSSAATLWRAFEELAWERADKRDYAGAAASYLEGLRVINTELGDDSLAAAAAHGKAGWMLALDGQYVEAQKGLTLGIVGFQAASPDHPIAGTLYTAMAAVSQSQGNAAEALGHLGQAFAIRQHALSLDRSAPADLPKATGIERSRWLSALGQASVTDDADRDGLADAIELALGLDPHRARSRDATRLDGDEDHDRDGWRDGLEFALDADPTRVIGHFGAFDPVSFGFQPDRPFKVQIREEPGNPRLQLNIVTNPLGHYWFNLTEHAKRAAMSGFTVTARTRLREGGGYVGLDLLPAGPRFDTDSYFTSSGQIYIKQNSSIVPPKGLEHAVGDSSAPLVQLEFRPGEGGVLWVDRRQVGSGYQGFTKYQEGQGFFFGAFNLRGAVPAGEVDVELAFLVIRSSK